jgi:methylenetetrahydrofolate dehydrogenase (NADP+)/methenyltetrahydrofolate cyclohydrolase
VSLLLSSWYHRTVKLLNGSDLASFIIERQARAVRGLQQAHDILPKLAIVVTTDNPIIEIYMRLKKRYGADIDVDVVLHRVVQKDVLATIETLNQDDSVHGIIVQLPLQDISQTDEVIAAISPQKDVDALGKKAVFDPATPTAILWLLAGYGIDIKHKKIVLLGRGKLVGAPLEAMLEHSDCTVQSFGASDNSEAALSNADIIITATGSPGSLTSEMIPKNCVVIDAGVAVESGRAVGDLADDVYTRDDIKVTPKKGGVGPLTVSALFENVILAAKNSAATDDRTRA